MSNGHYILSSGSQTSLAELGKNIRHSRVLRGMTQKRLCSVAGVARSTLQEIEKGSPGVTIGNYVKVLEAMGMEGHLPRIACFDNLWITKLTEQLAGRKRVKNKAFP